MSTSASWTASPRQVERDAVRRRLRTRRALVATAATIVVIGGMGSLTGTAVAALAVGLVQQLANYYAASGIGDLSVVLLLALVLLLRPSSLKGATA